MNSASQSRTTMMAAVASVLALSLFAYWGLVVSASGAEALVGVGSTEASDEGQDTQADTQADTEPGTEADTGRDDVLRLGAEVYAQICAACHQAGGVGAAGQFPPLAGNPNVDDADYVRDVINNGRQGPITVAGESYNGVMPSFSTLDDDEIDAVVEYIQSGFAAPAASEEAFANETTGPVAGTELPGFATVGSNMVWLLVAAIGLGVLGPRLVGANSRFDTPWFDAWLKTVAIVVGAVVVVVLIPNWAIQHSTVAKLSRTSQDVIGLVLWGGGLLALLAGLWYAHRESRI